MLKRLGGLSSAAYHRTRGLLRKSDATDSASGSVKKGGKTRSTTAVVLPAEAHSVRRESLSRQALKVLDRLAEAGHAAYLVGGGVRDALVGQRPKDFDIATDASPEEVRALFRNSRIIGRRFRLVHVVFGREIIEVATFRAAHDQGDGGEIGASGRIVRDNVFGSIEEDARRRDFSVNALYFNAKDASVVDYVGGLADIESRLFRLIGDPQTRCEEDPVRILRAARLSAKLDFTIHADTIQAMQSVAGELRHTPPARLFEEVLKLFQGGYAMQSFRSLLEHDLLQYLFPDLDKRLKRSEAGLSAMLEAALVNTDRRVASGKPITPAYLLAFMLWPDIEARVQEEIERGTPPVDALKQASETVLVRQLKVVSIPRRFSGPMKEIWLMQPRLERSRGQKALALIEERRFRAAYDFLCLRAEREPALRPLADWWTHIQTLDEEARERAVSEKPTPDGDRPVRSPRRKRRPRKSRSSDTREMGADNAEAELSGTAESEADASGGSDESGGPDSAADETISPPKRRRRRRRRRGGDRPQRAPDTPPPGD